MLISKRIAEDPKFLNTICALSRREAGYLINLRVKIMSSTKIIVGSEFLEVDSVGSTEPSFADGSSVALLLEGATKSQLARYHKEMDRRHQLYLAYAKLPMPLLAIESSKGMYFAEQVGKDRIRLTVIGADGTVYPMGCVVNTSELGATNSIQADGVFHYASESMERIFAERTQQQVEAVMQNVTGVNTLKFMDILLQFNVANSRIHKYTASKQELAKVPKTMGDKYVYHILDVFRERTVYHSLDEVEDYAGRTRDGSLYRAHLVKGHFKVLKTGVFWWNKFVRNRGNAETVGVVVKDYALH